MITGEPVFSPIYLLGQAPGPREGQIGKPFGWTAGKTLFRWFDGLGVSEQQFRERVYIGAVLRCFPGKATAGGGDRVPSPQEIRTCRGWLEAEVALLRPRLVLAVGRLAIEQVIGPFTKLEEVVGGVRAGQLAGWPVEVVPLPHPSGLSAWPKVEPGKTLLASALAALARHEAWQSVFGEEARQGPEGWPKASPHYGQRK